MHPFPLDYHTLFAVVRHVVFSGNLFFGILVMKCFICCSMDSFVLD